MLKKLLKHEFKATGRFFLPAYGIFAALLVIERLSMLASECLAGQDGPVGQLAQVLMIILTVITVLGLLAMIISPVIYAISRFYRNMLGDEGYLSFTLPVTTAQHIWSKLLTAGSWMIATLLVVCLYGFLFAVSVDAGMVWQFFRQVGELLRELYLAVGAWAIFLPVTALVAALTQVAANLLALYSAMSIGQTSNKHKLLSSAGVYILMQFVTSFLVQSLVLMVASIGVSGWFEVTDTTVSASVGLDGIGGEICWIMFIMFLGAAVINVLLSVLHFLLSRHFLTKRLNLA